MPEVLQLKQGARVMLLTNLSRDLVNGSLGVVKAFDQQRFPLVQFEDGHSLTIEPVTLTVADKNDPSKIVAMRTQLPLKLAWAITAHKSQGMTLSCVEVHCGNEFTSGQLYVPLTRAKESKGLSLVGFSKARLIPPPNVVVDFYSKLERDDRIALSGLCCNNAKLFNEVFEPPEGTENVFLENWAGEEEFTEEELLALDNYVAEYFESSNIPDSEESCLIDLDNVLDILDCSDDLAKPGVDFDCNLFLKSIKLPSNENRPLVANVNAVICSLMSPEHSAAFQTFFNIQWSRVFEKVKECVLSHKDQRIERKNFASLFGELHLLCVNDIVAKEFASVLQLEPSQLRREHHCTTTEVLSGINSAIICQVKQISAPEEAASMVFTNITNLPAESRGKIRHCMGWAVSREREKIRKEFRRHVTAENVSMRSLTKKDFEKKQLICSLTWSSETAHRDSKFQETLSVTDSRQFRNNGLTVVSDEVYLFALQLEEARVACLNMRALKNCKSNLIEIGLKELSSSEYLKIEWRKLFPVDVNIELVDELFFGVVSRYMNMAGAQFLRDFRRETKLRKTEAHRKKILVRSQVQELKGAKVSVEEVLADQSERKSKSHTLLQAMLSKQPAIFTSRVYKKEELKALLGLYGVIFNSSSDKEKLSELLVKCITEEPGFPVSGNRQQGISISKNDL